MSLGQWHFGHRCTPTPGSARAHVADVTTANNRADEVNSVVSNCVLRDHAQRVDDMWLSADARFAAIALASFHETLSVQPRCQQVQRVALDQRLTGR
jgi:hypothetical protein